jgi:hypothetical protein
MQLRDRAQGSGADVHGTEGDQGRQEINPFFLQVTCPVCKASIRERCIDLRGDKRRRIVLADRVHWRREHKAVKRVTDRLRGK